MKKQHVIKMKHSAVLFADVKGFSTLNEFQLQRFLSLFLPKIAKILEDHIATNCNSWGDGIVACFSNPRDAANCALELSDKFSFSDWGAIDMPALSVRIALNFGHIFVGYDPITKQEGLIGTQITLGARIEPITIPGQVWVTDTFIASLSTQWPSHIVADDLGFIRLYKDSREKHLFRLRRSTERGHDAINFETRKI